MLFILNHPQLFFFSCILSLSHVSLVLITLSPFVFVFLSVSKVNLSESDGSDAELSECSSDRKTFMSETDQRDSGNIQLLEIHCQIYTNTPHPPTQTRTN